MRWIPAALLSVVLAGGAFGARAQPAQLPEAARAQALLRDGRAEEAWQLLSPLERQYAGRADFDYQLAVAALESGRANLATFILERVIVVDPGSMAARLELARAYFALSDVERAEREFDLILKSDPPPDIRSLVSRYQARMREPLAGADAASGFRGYVEAGLGHDSNANVATSQGTIFVPTLGTEITLDAPSTSKADDFASVGAGLEYAHPLTRNLLLLAGAELLLRSYADVDAFDTGAADLSLGLQHRLGERDSMQYAARHNAFELDHARYRRIRSAAAEWSRLFGARAKLAFSAHGHRIRYFQEDSRASSSDLVAVGASAGYVLDAATRSVVVGTLSLGHDKAVADRPDGDRRLYGLSAALQRRVLASVDGYASIAFLNSDYRRANEDFDMGRRDRQIVLAAGLSWDFAQGWSMRPQIARTRNRSNIELNDYRRTETMISLRRTWR